MTGFARTDGALGPQRWHWEVRSVNGRGLDVRLRLPPGFDGIEGKLREAAQKRFTRGSVNATLTLDHQSTGGEIRLNEDALAQVMRAAARVREIAGGDMPKVEALLAVKGVLELAETDAGGDELSAVLIATFEQALEALAAARQAEGDKLKVVLLDQLHAIETETAVAVRSPARSVEAIRKRIEEQIARLVDASSALDPQRLHQEAVMLATRSDIEEEVKRLAAHIATARELIASKEPVGRKLDFLAQEFNREANTLCSKANDPEITRAGLALKAVIDQLREQVQNIE